MHELQGAPFWRNIHLRANRATPILTLFLSLHRVNLVLLETKETLVPKENP